MDREYLDLYRCVLQLQLRGDCIAKEFCIWLAHIKLGQLIIVFHCAFFRHLDHKAADLDIVQGILRVIRQQGDFRVQARARRAVCELAAARCRQRPRGWDCAPQPRRRAARNGRAYPRRAAARRYRRGHARGSNGFLGCNTRRCGAICPGHCAVRDRRVRTDGVCARAAGGVMLVAANGRVVARGTRPAGRGRSARCASRTQSRRVAGAAGSGRDRCGTTRELAKRVAAVNVGDGGLALDLKGGGAVRLGRRRARGQVRRGTRGVGRERRRTVRLHRRVDAADAGAASLIPIVDSGTVLGYSLD